jgi:anaerobic magnesium-protoporphyrin IX monomethyl ester cyclase
MNSKKGDHCDVLLVGYEETENLGLRYLYSYLEKEGISAAILPYNPQYKYKVLEHIRRATPALIGFSLIFQRMLEDFSELISFLRKNEVCAHFTMGGHFPTIEYKYIMEQISGLDSIIRCEGEETIVELFRNLTNHELLNSVKGLVYRQNGSINITPARQLIKNLDLLPFPARKEGNITHRKLGLSTIISSRGCYFNCSFCSIHEFYRGYEGAKRRSRTPQNVLDEIEMLFFKYHIRIFIFEDDDFIRSDRQKQSWITEFTNGLKQRNLHDKIIWRISCRVDEVDYDLIKLMSECGLVSVYLGIESGNENGLKYYNKHFNIKDVYKSIDTLLSLKMPFEFGFMLFNPETTFEGIFKDIEFLSKIGDSGEAIVHFTKMLPYAGTIVADQLNKSKRLKGTLSNPDYTYFDKRLDWLQHFFTLAFHFRNFEKSGLVESLRFAKFDSIVLEKFYPDQFDTSGYRYGIKELIKAANLQCTETMRLIATFVSDKTENQIIKGIDIIHHLINEEFSAQRAIEAELINVLDHYNFRDIP